MNIILSYVIFGFFALIGGGSTIFLVLSMIGMIVWKVYRKVKFGYSVFD